MLKKIILILVFFTSLSFAQFKDKDMAPSIFNGITNFSPSGFLTNFLNPDNFQMHHTVDLSYSAFGGNGVALSAYTNSMNFRLMENLNLELDASIVASPYSSFGAEHQKSLGGIYLTRARLDYKISKDAKLTIQYLNIPQGMYYNSNYIHSSRFGYYRGGF